MAGACCCTQTTCQPRRHRSTGKERSSLKDSLRADWRGEIRRCRGSSSRCRVTNLSLFSFCLSHKTFLFPTRESIKTQNKIEQNWISILSDKRRVATSRAATSVVVMPSSPEYGDAVMFARNLRPLALFASMDDFCISPRACSYLSTFGCLSQSIHHQVGGRFSNPNCSGAPLT